MEKRPDRIISDDQAIKVAAKAASHMRSAAAASWRGINVRTGSIVITDDEITISESPDETESS